MCGCCTPACWCRTRHWRRGRPRRRCWCSTRGAASARPWPRRRCGGASSAPGAGLGRGGPAQQRAYRADRPLGRAVRRGRHGLGPLRQRRRPRAHAGALSAAATPASAPTRSPPRCPARTASRRCCSTWRPAPSPSARRGSRATRACRCRTGVLIDEHGRPDHRPDHLCRRSGGAPCSRSAPTRARASPSCARCWGPRVTGGATIAPHHERQDGILNSMLSFIVDLSALGDRRAHRAGDARRSATGSRPRRRPPGFDRGAAAGRAGAAGTRAAASPRACRSTIRSLADILAAIASLGVAEAEIDRALGR